MTGEIAVLPTRYNGVLYRSRTEARWAVFFAAMGVEAQYEPETFRLPSGLYLPDFFIPAWRVFVEVKGRAPSVLERKKCHELAEATAKPVFLAIGDPANKYGELFTVLMGVEAEGRYGGFAKCRKCDQPVLKYDGGMLPLIACATYDCGFDVFPGFGISSAIAAASDERFGAYPETIEVSK